MFRNRVDEIVLVATLPAASYENGRLAFDFVSYRRDDSAGSTGRLFDRLRAGFPDQHVFMDVDTVEPGVDFIEAIDQAVAACDVLIAVIGAKWLDARNRDGGRRVDDLADFVRIEIAAALRRKVRVIPVLVDGASMPAADDLPEELKPLARRQACEISHGRFAADIDQLVRAVASALERAGAPVDDGEPTLSRTSKSTAAEGRSFNPAKPGAPTPGGLTSSSGATHTDSS